MTGAAPEDLRLNLLTHWLDEVLPGHDAPRPASSDASFRRYFRVFCGDQPWIVMDAPPEQEDCRPFIAVSAALNRAGVQVPKVHAQDLSQGFLLLDDLGQDTLLVRLSSIDSDAAYRAAIDMLVRIQQAEAQDLPPYDEALLRREMNLFKDWYIGVHRQQCWTARQQAAWDRVVEQLCAAALAQPRVFVHRDYHSRNLMWPGDGSVGVLDFQDAVHGPITYDLVSLLRDCYVAWPADQLAAWLAYYHEQASAAGLPVADLATLRRDLDWMGVQRHLKAVGIFARLNHRDGKASYLEDIPRTLTYLRDVSAAYPELAFLHDTADACLS